jgi:hypothetical protein
MWCATIRGGWAGLHPNHHRKMRELLREIVDGGFEILFFPYSKITCFSFSYNKSD